MISLAGAVPRLDGEIELAAANVQRAIVTADRSLVTLRSGLGAPVVERWHPIERPSLVWSREVDGLGELVEAGETILVYEDSWIARLRTSSGEAVAPPNIKVRGPVI